MKNDQDLIFEAYTKTLNESVYKASDVKITNYNTEGIEEVDPGTFNQVPVTFKDNNGTSMTGIVDSLNVDERGQVNASGEIHDAKVGTLEEDDNVADDYPDHEQILSNIREIVDENIGHGEGHEHSRETLDDIIDDLVRYRNGLPTADDYMRGGKL